MTVFDKESEEYKQAKIRVEEIKAFWSHLAVYIIVNLGLFLINILTTPRHLWFFWPLFGWGIGVFAHGFHTFGARGIFGKEWEEKQIKKYMENYKDK